MLFDIKKLFAKDTQIGRFEYLKIVWGLALFPILAVYLAVLTPDENPLIYPAAILTVVLSLLYLVVFWVATYKRLMNIFGSRIISGCDLLQQYRKGEPALKSLNIKEFRSF